MQITIREATIDDARQIADFNSAMALETENKLLDPDTINAGVRAVFENKAYGLYLVAQVTDGEHTETAGCLMVTREWSDWRNGEFWWVQSVYVIPSRRRKGIYRALYGHLKKISRDKVCGFRLYVEKHNHTAQNTYAELGMQPTVYELYEEMIHG